MEQITEDYCSFGTAKLLKEKGFDEKVDTLYKMDAEFLKSTLCINYNDTKFTLSDMHNIPENTVSAPTIQMAMKWLREEHNKIIVPGISLDDRTSSTINHYNVGIWYIPKNNGGAFCYTSPTPYNGYSSFEEACEAAIKYCLENLI